MKTRFSKLIVSLAAVLAGYVLVYVALRCSGYMHILEGIGYGGQGYMIYAGRADGHGGYRVNHLDLLAVDVFKPCWVTERAFRPKGKSNEPVGLQIGR